MNVLLLHRFELAKDISKRLMEPSQRQVDCLHRATPLVLPRLVVRVKEFDYLRGYLPPVLATRVQVRSLLYAYKRLQKVWCRNQALQDRVHEAGVVLAILKA